jgi:mono/diheme cytochrome c family protein
MSKGMSKRERREALHRQKRRQRLMWGVGIAGVLLLFLGGFVYLVSNAPEKVVVSAASDVEVIALGEQVYAAQCAACHGENLEGEPNWQQPGEDGVLKAPPHNETGHTWHHDDAYLIESIKLGGARLPDNVGVSPMPAYETVLSDEEITAVLAYIKSNWPPDIVAAQAKR